MLATKRQSSGSASPSQDPSITYIQSPGKEAPFPAAKLHPDLVRAVLSSCSADPVDVRAFATRSDVIGVESGDVRHSGNQHAVAINVDVVQGSSIPGEVRPLLPL